MEEQGRPPGDGFCPSRAWLVSGQDAGPGRLGAGTPTRASLGATCPTLQVSGPVHRVPGVVSVEREDLPATQGTAPFPVDHTSQLLSHTRRGKVPGKK